jgi:general secretion pathway protein B
MSLILDALKKSEAERQRQSGPTLLEVRVTQPRRRYPVWVIAVGVLLAVNILLLLAFVLRRPVAPPAEAPVEASAAAPRSAPTAAPAANPGALPASVAPMAAPAATAPGLPAAGDIDAGTLVAPPRSFSAPDAGADGPNGSGNPADDEPAVAPGTSAHYAGLPSFNDVGGDLPQLRLDLHVYSMRARDRYALINMHRVHEGDTLPEGPQVLAITREGVALTYRGQDFMLRPQ